MAKKKSTISEIAKELGITPSAVSYALRDHPRISEKTKQAVRETAKKLNYQPNYLASALRKGKSNSIGVLVPRINMNFFSSIVRGIEEIANKNGYAVIISQSDESYVKEKRNVESLLRSQVDAVFASISLSTKDLEHFQKVIDNDIPLILFDRVSESLDVDMITIDDYKGAYIATKHLIDQGCKRIAHFVGNKDLSIYQNRIKGYNDALRENNIPIDEMLTFESDLNFEDGVQQMKEALPKNPDGILVSSDIAAMGAIQVIKENNLSIPKDIAIVGFSNEPFTQFVSPSLSTVDQFSHKMGKVVAETFFDKEKQSKEDRIHKKIVLPPELIIRESSKKN